MKESRLILIILLITFLIYSVFYLSTRDVEISDNQDMP
jgi:flagellar biogenesis protein FliO